MYAPSRTNPTSERRDRQSEKMRIDSTMGPADMLVNPESARQTAIRMVLRGREPCGLKANATAKKPYAIAGPSG